MTTAHAPDMDGHTRQLEQALREKEAALKELQHRAKNSLAIAASLLAIQGRRQPDPAVRALFEEAGDRLNAMARVHDLLSKSERAQRVDVSVYLADLCQALRPITENDDRIQLEAKMKDAVLVDAYDGVI